MGKQVINVHLNFQNSIETTGPRACFYFSITYKMELKRKSSLMGYNRVTLMPKDPGLLMQCHL